MHKSETFTERINRITNTPTLVLTESAAQTLQTKRRRRTSGTIKSAADLAQYNYLPAFDVWQRTIQALVASRAVTPTQADNWLRPCELATMMLPSGAVLAAALGAPSSYAPDHIRHNYAAAIRSTMQVITQKQVVLFVRGPDQSPWSGPPDGTLDAA